MFLRAQFGNPFLEAHTVISGPDIGNYQCVGNLGFPLPPPRRRHYCVFSASPSLPSLSPHNCKRPVCVISCHRRESFSPLRSAERGHPLLTSLRPIDIHRQHLIVCRDSCESNEQRTAYYRCRLHATKGWWRKEEESVPGSEAISSLQTTI